MTSHRNAGENTTELIEDWPEGSPELLGQRLCGFMSTKLGHGLDEERNLTSFPTSELTLNNSLPSSHSLLRLHLFTHLSSAVPTISPKLSH